MSETFTKNKKAGFAGLGLSPRQLDVVRSLGFKTPTPIQKQALPIAIKGNDVMGIAQTGTGKTLAFGLPIVESIARQSTNCYRNTRSNNRPHAALLNTIGQRKRRRIRRSRPHARHGLFAQH